MTEVRFYHLQRKSLEQALPELLEKILERGHRTVLRAGSAERVEALNQHLWTWRPDSFLPHGSAADGHAERQPVFLTDGTDNPNRADVLVLVDRAGEDGIDAYALACTMFDGNDPEALAAAREQWRRCKDAGHDLTYWQQTDRGGWQKQA